MPKANWRFLSSRIEQLLGAQDALIALELSTELEALAKGVAKAKRGRSREKRADCPLITLGLVLDGSGFPRASEFFAGNASEPDTLQAMLTGLNSCAGSTVVMDADIASEANITWLLEQGYRYLVVSRKRQREFDPEQAVVVKEEPGQTVRIQRVANTETGEVENQQRITVSLKREDGKTIHVRKTTRAEPHQKTIYDALGISANPGKIEKTLI